MTQKEKFKAIAERLSVNEDYKNLDPMHISMMVIIGYLNDMSKMGLIEQPYDITPLGKNIQAICEEFDWKPSDKEIVSFVMEMVNESERMVFVYMLGKYRDDRESVVKRFKKSDGGIDKSE